MKRLFLWLGLCAGVVGAEPQDEAQKKELARIQGDWEVTSYEVKGKKMSKDEILKVVLDGKVTFQGNKMRFLNPPDRKEEAKIQLFPMKSPAAIDISPETGSQKGKTAKGIYKLDGDIMIICNSGVDQDRPAKFESGTDFFLITLRRVKNPKR